MAGYGKPIAANCNVSAFVRMLPLSLGVNEGLHGACLKLQRLLGND